MSEPAIPAPPGEVSDLQNPEDVIHTVNFATQVICLVVTSVIVALRFLVKARLRKALEFEDCEFNIANILVSVMVKLTVIVGRYHDFWMGNTLRS